MRFRTLAAAALGCAFLAHPAAAQPEIEGSLLALQSKAVKKGGAVRVIVEFAEPEGAPADGLMSAQGMRARTGALRARQNDIIAKALGPSAAQAGTASADPRAKLMDYVPMLAMQANPAVLARLAADPRVVRIVESRPEKPTLLRSLAMIGVTGAGGSFARGADGRGRAVAIVDTGVNYNHEFLKGKVIAEACFSTTEPLDGSYSLCPGGAPSSTAKGAGLDCWALEGCGHGTHVAGIAAGRNTSLTQGEPYTGVAKFASIVAVKVFSRVDDPWFCGGSSSCVGSYPEDTIKGLEWILSISPVVANRRIDAVNLSLGGYPASSTFCDTDVRAGIIKLLRDKNVATVVSSGNDGLTRQVLRPACVSRAIAVGASTKATASRPERIASYSNSGNPVDVMAPGGDFGYPVATGAAQIISSFGNGYRALAGTSMAAPHVTGAIAAIRSKPACATKTVAQIEYALRNSGPLIADKRAGGVFTRHRLNLPAALKMLGCP